LLNTAVTLWPLFSKIVRNFVVPTQPATWAIQLNLCLKPQPLELFGPVQQCTSSHNRKGHTATARATYAEHTYINPLP
jgi:hypothetical protein